MTVELVLLSRVAYRGREVTGAGPPGLLALLAGELRAGRSAARLIDELWPEDRPEHPAKALQLLVSRVRARLGAELIASTPTGYRLALDPDQIDAEAVLRHAVESEKCARDGDHPGALAQAVAGLAWCEGTASWVGAAADPLSALRAARVPAYWTLVRARGLALSRLGRAAEAIGPLGELARDHPRDEEILAELMRCEAATTSPAAALARYDGYRRALRAELGSDPGPALREVHRALLLSDAPQVRRGVQQEPNPMLGRDDDVAAVTGLLRTSRVVCVVGAGGLGKTRLAHAVARAAEQRVVHLVGLAGVTADEDVAGEVASALGVRQEGRHPVAAGIADAFGPGLLVLDNCEHVVDGAAGLVGALVAASRDLRILTTSRAPLRLSSEAVYHLPELDLPAMVELFGQRARAIRPGVELPPDVVRQLCERLDGLPLAAELAAARVPVMSVAELARRLDDRFELLRGGARDAPSRHRTLYAVIDWSWHLLDSEGRQAMRTLSVFPGGFTAVAARHVLGSDAILEQLVDQSLLRVAEAGAGTRFRMLEAVREFSAAQRTEAVIDRFLGWAADFAAPFAESDFLAGLAAAPVIRAEQDNLLQALRYGLDRADGAAVASVAALLGGLWVTESSFTRLATLARDTGWLLSHFRPGPDIVEAARAASVLGALIGYVMPELSPLRALAALRRLPPAPPDTPLRALHVVLCAPDGAALAALAADDRPQLAAVANYVLSYLCESVNDLESALRAARRMLASLGADDLPLLRGMAHGRIGELCLQVDPGEPALRHLTAALSFTERLGWTSTVRGRWAQALAHLQCGDYDAAERALAEAAQGSGEVPGDLERFDVCARAEIRLGRGDVEGGLRLWREAAGRPGAADGGLWPYEVEAVAVVTHARHGRTDQVRDIVEKLPGVLTALVPIVPVAQFPICGSLLLALAVAELDAGPAAHAVRMIALAERFGILRGFQPAMDPARIRAVAERADRPTYAAAVTAYAGLGPEDELRAAALKLVDLGRG